MIDTQMSLYYLIVEKISQICWFDKTTELSNKSVPIYLTLVAQEFRYLKHFETLHFIQHKLLEQISIQVIKVGKEFGNTLLNFFSFL